MKNSTLKKSSYVKSNLKKKKKKKNGTRVSCKILTLLDFHPIEFQNKVILLDNFRTWAFCYIFWAKKANAHFGCEIHSYTCYKLIIHEINIVIIEVCYFYFYFYF